MIVSFARWWWRWRWQLAGAAGVACSAMVCAGQCAVPASRHASQDRALGLKAQERLVAVQHDPLLNSDWGSIVSCEHPERPARMVALPVGFVRAATLVNFTTQPERALTYQVRAGERVLLFRQDGMTRIETVGTTEENAVEGQRIHVRQLPAALDGSGARTTVVGVVRAARSVEILR